MPTEAELDEAIATVKTEIGAAADRVIAKIAELEANHPELSDEIVSLSEAAAALRAIAPVTEPPTP